MAIMGRKVTWRATAQQIQFVTHHSVSTRTIRCRLQQSEMSVRRLLLHLPLTGNHWHWLRQKCDERRTWEME
ncbi:hypothetical protein TNCV_1177291 [Trichonephila clavipes]|nr:hypothetical protein TNCV_1177291 [Trichonephila clavipes]